MPAHVATRALAEGSAAIDDFGSAMVAAVDVAGFSEIVRHAGGAADTGSVVAMSFVRDAFGIAAVLAQKYQVRLLRRSGTSLLVAAGTLGRGQSDAPLPAEAIADAERLALFGLELIENVRVWGVERWGAELSAKLGAGVRVGISKHFRDEGLSDPMSYRLAHTLSLGVRASFCEDVLWYRNDYEQYSNTT